MRAMKIGSLARASASINSGEVSLARARVGPRSINPGEVSLDRVLCPGPTAGSDFGAFEGGHTVRAHETIKAVQRTLVSGRRPQEGVAVEFDNDIVPAIKPSAPYPDRADARA